MPLGMGLTMYLLQRKERNGMAFPQKLIDGYRQFHDNRLPREQARFRQLAEAGQKPQSMIIGCVDSRVAPEVIFDTGPGELFVLRNVANLVPPYAPDDRLHGVSAALEFAIHGLGIENIIVLGHARCGGVKAYAENMPALSSSDFIGKWVSLIKPASDGLGPRNDQPMDSYLVRLEQASILASLNNLLSFPWINSRVQNNSLQLHAAYFDVANGQLSVGDAKSGLFTPAAGG